MATTIKTTTLSISNPALAALAGRKYSDSYTNVPNSKLPAAVTEVLDVVYQSLTGDPLQLDSNTIAVSARDNMFFRLYAPKLYSGSTLEDGTVTPDLYIKWGNERIALEQAEGKLVPVHKSANKVGIKFGLFNPSGKGEDPALEIRTTVKQGKDSEVYLLAIAAAPESWKEYSADLFNTAIENDDSDFPALLTAEVSGGKSSGGRTEGEITDRKSLVAAVFGSVDEQTRPLDFVCTGYRQVKTGYGFTFILQCEASTDAEVLARLPMAATKFCVWADGLAKGVLFSSPEVSPSKPASLVFPVGSTSKLLLDASSIAAAGGIDLDFG